ncbi:uncharacterized protein Z519_03453 [Cladophialophora bantiana CBS 173.52]|uniref:Polyprenal reductase n=1 Tax=Cladophialophora bantiana (strain ATCC 10958 / CBS 173.52 / CDC B-1940 / NIH 8579) TaxID=1442370 RepID=A0A0D2II20_CLAB1|nr:uncharacterized protein Z519_03453 [Cladophialophora bantiana CBS 173.52]KIW96384.1 hypothetical protein Z519_03453 [Cladophialophora bantiana CBS 173.52]
MLNLVIWAIRAFYLLSSLAIFAVRLIPALGDRFLAYGARARDPARGSEDRKQKQPSVGVKFLDYVATFTVPHSWFTHFYILSIACSLACLFTFHQYAGTTENQDTDIPAFCSMLMLVQGCRRLVECLVLTQQSKSRMWIGHYAIGMAYYIATNIAIWVEHLDANLIRPSRPDSDRNQGSILWTSKTLICTIVFFWASDRQNLYHRYLSSLKKYTLPEKHAFRWIVAPHYTAECLIYLSLAVVDAPPSQQHHHHHLQQYHYNQKPATTSINWTLFCALVFVTVNLGVTAAGTKEWLRTKFPDRAWEIIKRWRMIPFVF